jgi:pimeloyl-ACP methyl ester carboxylesterase
MNLATRIFVFVLATVGVFAILAIVLLRQFQERLIFYPEPLPSDYRFEGRAEEKWIETSEGKVHSVLVRAPKPHGILLYFHGNAGNLSNWWEVADEIAGRTSWNVWIVDYPGYGKSPGRIRSEKQLQTIAQEWATLAKRENPELKLAYYGRSIGSGIAVRLATEVACDALILESPYFSLARLAREIFPAIPGFVLRYEFRSDRQIASVPCPILVVHGEKDEVIPVRHGRDLAAAGNATFQAVPRAGHNDLSLYPDYWKSVREFLDRFGGSGT